MVSLIRICGNASLRAFIGRANEAPGEAENELLSCVSEGTAELFNNGGISRVSGRPRILEVVVWEEQGSNKFGHLRDALEDGAWSAEGEEIQHEKGLHSLPELDIPNLSLNKGIKRRGIAWFYLAALVGIALQGGVFSLPVSSLTTKAVLFTNVEPGTLIYATMAVFWYSKIFEDDEDSPANYALPLYLYGSVSLSLGMFLCAFLIERSSSESYLYSTKPSKIYWLQPGRQSIGDQDFGAFLAVDEGPYSSTTQHLTYTKSVRGPTPKGRRPFLIFTICITATGFIAQFVGLRGLHPSVIIADVGSTLLMAAVRTLLRTKRIGSEGNRFSKEDREVFSHNQQELDCFAYQLENVESFRLVSSPVHHTARSRSGSCSTDSCSQTSIQTSGLGAKLIRTRAQLAKLTSCSRHPSMDWDDLPIRKVAHDLASTIEMTMEVVSRWKEVPGSTCSFELSFACQHSHKSMGSPLETYSITLTRSDDTLQWRVDENELEAILGLWTFSLLKSDPKWLGKGLGRAVGLTKAEASAEATDLYFHKWIYRQREAVMVSSKMISFSEQSFGYYSDSRPDSKEILVVKTENSLEVMAAQDIYIQFLMSILTGIKSLNGRVDILPVSQTGFLAQSVDVDELVSCFESGNLGSREDALLCVVPVLNHLGVLPTLAGDTVTVRERVQKLTSDGNWDDAFSILQWLSMRCEGDEFENSIYELGLLCQRAILTRKANVRDKGLEIAKSILQCDPRFRFFRDLRSPRSSNWMGSHDRRKWWASFSRQLGWAIWHISNRLGQQGMICFLESIGHSRNLAIQTSRASVDHMEPGLAPLMVLASLDPERVVELQGDYQYENDLYLAECLEWVNTTEQRALRYWFLARWAEVGQQFPHQAMRAFVRAAQSYSDSTIQTLCRLGADIDAIGNEGCTALMELVATGNMEATKKLLVHGADVNSSSAMNKMTSLSFAAIQGREDFLVLLLDHGADLELRNLVGYTALHSACTENQLLCAALLLERGADSESIAADGRTPILSVTVSGDLDMVSFLIDMGVNINATDPQGDTALTLATNLEYEEVIRLLLGRQADQKKRNNMGKTALDIAKERENGSIVAILEAA